MIRVTRRLARAIRAAVYEAMGGGRWLVEAGQRAGTLPDGRHVYTFNTIDPVTWSEGWDLFSPWGLDEVGKIPEGAVELDCYVYSYKPAYMGGLDTELVSNVSVFLVDGRIIGAAEQDVPGYDALKQRTLELAGDRVEL